MRLWTILSLFLSLMLACAEEGGQGQSADTDSAKTNSGEQLEAVRGVWLTNVASDVLLSRQNIAEAMELLDSLGFNTVFVVTWNKAHTIYRSEVVEAVTGREIDPVYGERDPLQEVIEEAHARDLKVFAWFEFGFASSMGQQGGVLLEKKPHWASRDQQGDLTKKNGFEWMNPFHPEVQQFITDMVLEVVNKYDVDGIQGDDRLPALPSTGGYDEYTVELYKAEHDGQAPPRNAKDYEWIKWRSARLTLFLRELYEQVKVADPECLVSMAPSVYPWAEENYLQDWPAWMNMGIVDLLCPQLYRYDLEAYEKTLMDLTSGQVSADELKRVYPGVLLQVNDYNPTPEQLRQMIELNRQYGMKGEVHFFYEGVPALAGTFLELYAQERASFPNDL